MLGLAEVKPGDVVYDLGCGDGRVVVSAAGRYGALAVGLDLDPHRVREACRSVEKAGLAGRATIRQGDIFRANLGEASVVTPYPLPDLDVRLMPQLARLADRPRLVQHEGGPAAAGRPGPVYPGGEDRLLPGRSLEGGGAGPAGVRPPPAPGGTEPGAARRGTRGDALSKASRCRFASGTSGGVTNFSGGELIEVANWADCSAHHPRGAQ